MRCYVEACVNNDKGLCTVESMVEICENGGCSLKQISNERLITVLQTKLSNLTTEYERSVAENKALTDELLALKVKSDFDTYESMLPGTKVWLLNKMFGVIEAVIDAPWHYKVVSDGKPILEGSFSWKAVGNDVFLDEDKAKEAWVNTYANTK